MRNNPALVKTVTAILVLSLVLVGVPIGTAAASNGGTFIVDVWTNKGGKGANVPGGTYQVGEERAIYFRANTNCGVRWTLSGPSMTDSGEQGVQAGGVYERSLGQAEERDIGQWEVVVEARHATQYFSDTTTFTVVGAEPEPPPMPEPAPESAPPPPPIETEEKPTAKVNTSNATELLALIAMRMTEGLLTADPNMDANGDGEVTMEDVRLILRWAVKGPGGVPSKPYEEKEVETAPEPTTVHKQALLGKWKMTRLSIQPKVPDLVPNFVVNLVIPQKATWEIIRHHGELEIKYGGKNTWYKKTFLKGISEGSTTVYESESGLSCVFETNTTFSWDSLPLGLGFLTGGKIKQIRGTFTSKVQVSTSSDNRLEVTITVDNVDGTYYEGGTRKPINFAGGKVTYYGVKK